MENLLGVVKEYLEKFLLMQDSTSILEVVIFYFVVTVAILFFIYIIFKIFKRKERDPNEVFETVTEDLKHVQEEIKQIEKQEIEEKSQFDLEQALKQMETNVEEVIEKEIENFETLQEEKSIISYQELKKETEIETKRETPVYEDNIDLENTNRYRRSDFISPVYGLQDEYVPKHQEEIKIEKNKEKVASNQFLDSLKELRKSLD